MSKGSTMKRDSYFTFQHLSTNGHSNLHIPVSPSLSPSYGVLVTDPMNIDPTLYGERHSPGIRASASNITSTNLGLGQVRNFLKKSLTFLFAGLREIINIWLSMCCTARGSRARFSQVCPTKGKALGLFYLSYISYFWTNLRPVPVELFF